MPVGFSTALQQPITYNRKGSIYSPFARNMVSADFDGDGKDDLVIASTTYYDILFARGFGNGKFSEIFTTIIEKDEIIDTYNSICAPTMSVGDFNGDGKPDIALATELCDDGRSRDNKLRIFLNTMEWPTTTPLVTTSTSYTSTTTTTSSMFKLVETNSPTTASPTEAPSANPTTASPTEEPSVTPTTASPTEAPSVTSTTASPTEAPSVTPTTASPTEAPSNMPTYTPSPNPTELPEEVNVKAGFEWNAELEAHIALGFGVGSFVLLLGGFAYLKHKIDDSSYRVSKQTSTFMNPEFRINFDTEKGTTTNDIPPSTYEVPVLVSAQGFYDESPTDTKNTAHAYEYVHNSPHNNLYDNPQLSGEQQNPTEI